VFFFPEIKTNHNPIIEELIMPPISPKRSGSKKKSSIPENFETPLQPPEVEPSTHIMFVLDNSGSMGGQSITEAISGTWNFFEKNWHPNVEFGLLSFNDTIRVLHPLGTIPDTTSKEIFKTHLQNGANCGGGTALWDSLKIAIDEFAVKKSTSSSDKFIVVGITDGDDTSSKNFPSGSEGIDPIIAYAKSKGIDLRLFFIGIGSTDFSGLEKICAATGGNFIHATGTAGSITGSIGKMSKRVTRILHGDNEPDDDMEEDPDISDEVDQDDEEPTEIQKTPADSQTIQSTSWILNMRPNHAEFSYIRFSGDLPWSDLRAMEACFRSVCANLQEEFPLRGGSVEIPVYLVPDNCVPYEEDHKNGNNRNHIDQILAPIFSNDELARLQKAYTTRDRDFFFTLRTFEMPGQWLSSFYSDRYLLDPAYFNAFWDTHPPKTPSILVRAYPQRPNQTDVANRIFAFRYQAIHSGIYYSVDRRVILPNGPLTGETLGPFFYALTALLSMDDRDLKEVLTKCWLCGAWSIPIWLARKWMLKNDDLGYIRRRLTELLTVFPTRLFLQGKIYLEDEFWGDLVAGAK
jgi:hypothetical protein